MTAAPDLDLEEERQLCERARAGQRAALGALLERHGPRLYRSVLLPRLGNRALAEEALAITYTRVIERIAQFEWQAIGLYPWLRTLAFHVAIDLLRKQKRERLFEPEDLEKELGQLTPQPTPVELLEARDRARARERVEELLGKVHPRYAQALRMRILEEQSREDCATQLGVTVSTFDVVLHRAMTALKQQIAQEEEP